MGIADIVLEAGLIGLLVVMLVHCVRLQRTLGDLRQDRVALHDAIVGFDTGTRQAEAGLSRLRAVADELGAQLGKADALRDDLVLLSERGDALANRLDALVRVGRMAAPVAAMPPHSANGDTASARLPSAAERNLMLALQGRR